MKQIPDTYLKVYIVKDRANQKKAKGIWPISSGSKYKHFLDYISHESVTEH